MSNTQRVHHYTVLPRNLDGSYDVLHGVGRKQSEVKGFRTREEALIFIADFRLAASATGEWQCYKSCCSTVR